MKKVYIWIFLALLATYITLAFTLPADPQVLSKHGLTQASSRMLSLSIVVPIALIYLSALYGLVRVNDYADKVIKSEEGPYLKKLASGLTVLAFSLPIGSIIGSLASYAKHAEPHLYSDITIISGYVTLIFSLTAMILVSNGAHGLHGTLKATIKSTPKDTVKPGQPAYQLIGPIALASVYTWLVISQIDSDPHGQIYFLPGWLLVTTLVIPYIFTWYIGIGAVVVLRRYQMAVKGIIYKRAINYLAKGIAVTVLVSILLRFLLVLSGRLNRLDLTPLLVVVYALILLYALGYGLIARGAKKLKQIEEV